jgi:hypothetical protein
VLICIPCLEVRQPDSLLGLHDPGQPWETWGRPIDGCGRIRISASGSCTGAARHRRADPYRSLVALAEVFDA